MKNWLFWFDMYFNIFILFGYFNSKNQKNIIIEKHLLWYSVLIHATYLYLCCLHFSKFHTKQLITKELN